MDKSEDNRKPERQVRSGTVVASVWKNSGGKTGHFYTVTFQRFYRKTDDEPWQYSQSYGLWDLFDLVKAAGGAHTWIFQQTRQTADSEAA